MSNESEKRRPLEMSAEHAIPRLTTTKRYYCYCAYEKWLSCDFYSNKTGTKLCAEAAVENNQLHRRRERDGALCHQIYH